MLHRSSSGTATLLAESDGYRVAGPRLTRGDGIGIDEMGQPYPGFPIQGGQAKAGSVMSPASLSRCRQPPPCLVARHAARNRVWCGK